MQDATKNPKYRKYILNINKIKLNIKYNIGIETTMHLDYSTIIKYSLNNY